MKKYLLFISIGLFLLFSYYYLSIDQDDHVDKYTLLISDDIVIMKMDEAKIEKNLLNYLQKLNQNINLNVQYADTDSILSSVNENVNTIGFIPSDSFIGFQLDHGQSNLQQLYVAIENSTSETGQEQLSLQANNRKPYITTTSDNYQALVNKNIGELIDYAIKNDLTIATTNNSYNYGILWLYACTELENLDFSKLHIKTFANNYQLYDALEQNKVDLVINNIPKFSTLTYSEDFKYLNYPEYQELFLNPLVIYNTNIDDDSELAIKYIFKEMFNAPDILEFMEKLLAWVKLEPYQGTTNIDNSRQILDVFSSYQKYLEEQHETFK